MKKNEQLFDIMGDIPEKYVEDAINDNAITEKRISAKRIFRTIAAAAAVFAAVCAVPVAVVIMNHRVGNDPDILPASTEVSSETTEVTDVQPENTENSDQNEEENRLSFGTGPERPENYTPDRKYSYCSLDYCTLNDVSSDRVLADEKFIKNYLKTILVDESFADDIFADCQSKSEKYVESLDLDEDEYDFRYTLPYLYYGKCMNGYFEIDAYVHIYETGEDKTYYCLYDLVEEKMIDDYSDLFYYGEDYISKIGEEMFGTTYSKSDSPELFMNLDYLIIEKADGNRVDECLDKAGFDISVIGRYRDLTGVIKEEYLAESEYDEWYNYFSDVAVDDFTVKMYSDGSRYHSESEINSKNSKRQERCGVVLDYLKEHHYLDNYDEKNLEMIIAFDDSAFEVYGHDRSEFLGVFKFDTEKEKVLPADTNIPEWRNYVKGYFTGDDYDHLNTDMSFDLNNCDLQNYLWLRFYYISEEAVNRGNVPDTDYSVVLSNEEIENLNDVALAVKAYNRDTLEQINLLVVIPFEKIDDPNYTKDNFLDEPYAEKIIFCDK